jgi:hypothetical protein
VSQGIASCDSHRALDQDEHAGRGFSGYEQSLTRGIPPNQPKTAETIDFTRIELRKHLLAACIDRRHVEPRGPDGNDPIENEIEPSSAVRRTSSAA